MSRRATTVANASIPGDPVMTEYQRFQTTDDGDVTIVQLVDPKIFDSSVASCISSRR